MKVLALGGCGGMGQFAVRTALDYDFIEFITIADMNFKRAQEFAKACGVKTKAIYLNIEDQPALSAQLKNHDIVMTTIGPYYRFGLPILKAAIEAGCHYIDICDDWEPTLDMLKLHDDAKKACITAIIGIGASPGISNMLAKKAMTKLHSVDRLITGWGQGNHRIDEMQEAGQGGSMGAAYEHWFHQLSGNIRVRQNGEMADVPPLQEVVIDYPGIGACTTYTVGHPEPLTLSLYHPSIHSSVNVMDFEASLIEMVRWIACQIDEKKMTVAEAAKYFMKIEHKSVPALLFSRIGPALFKGIWKDIRVKRKPLPLIFALATGTESNKPATAAANLNAMPLGGMEVENMGAATGVPLAVALELFAKGKITKKGVFAPEGIMDPDDFFNDLAPLCTPAFKNAKELISVKIV